MLSQSKKPNKGKTEMSLKRKDSILLIKQTKNITKCFICVYYLGTLNIIMDIYNLFCMLYFKCVVELLSPKQENFLLNSQTMVFTFIEKILLLNMKS